MSNYEKLPGRKSQITEFPFSTEKKNSGPKEFFWTPRLNDECLVIGDDFLPPDVPMNPTNYEASHPMFGMEDQKLSPVKDDLIDEWEDTDETNIAQDKGRGKALKKQKKAKRK